MKGLGSKPDGWVYFTTKQLMFIPIVPSDEMPEEQLNKYINIQATVIDNLWTITLKMLHY